MKPFALTPEMTSSSGTFYPTGYVFALFKDEQAARNAGQQLRDAGRNDVAYATSHDVMEHVVRTLGNADDPLPSVGAEGVIVRRIAELASGGGHALMFEAADGDSPDSLRTLLQSLSATAGFYYRRLIIEDLIAT
ncbi:hypothetical protein [Pulveribacter suum]|uniref:Uncharacterized protein n=1 Tax=Pulveribacter suum TaxID=2116657 RepID=A0A2P1NLT1_9BURK|nr:hypothetical protein [Pulveribacter suum]AVP58011.1 hypothetical protein C7H73_10285 [Pulveribacter suum]